MNHQKKFFHLLTILLFTSFLSGAPLATEEQKKTAAGLLRQTGNRGGLVVHICCGKPRSLGMAASLHAGGGFLVQALYTDRSMVQNARRRLQSSGLAGPVSVAPLHGDLLPYTDNLVDLLVVSKNTGIPEDELMRVLAPRGILFVKNNGTWEKRVKPMPGEIDEWTHYLHGPDNNAVAADTKAGPPRHMQWTGGPAWTRNHHKLNSISAVVTANGRLFSIVDRASAANTNLPGKWFIVARNAFNGVLLWEKPIDSWAWHKIRFRSGPPQLPRLLVASESRVYLPLGLNRPVSALDAATGKTVKTFKNTAASEELILTDEMLFVVKGAPVAEQAVKHNLYKSTFLFPSRKHVTAVNLTTGKTAWNFSDDDGNLMPETICSDGKKVFFQTQKGIVCLDAQTGERLWYYNEKQKKTTRKRRPTYGTFTLVVKNNVILCNLYGRLTALSAENGEKLWDCKAGGGFHAPLDIFVIDNCVWQGLHIKDSISPPPVDDFNKCRDLFTGEQKRTNSLMVDIQTEGHHHRCYREKATTRYILTGKRGIELMDITGDNHSRNNWIRGTCQYGIMPANGLLYAPPHSCGCYMESKLRGFWAIASERPVVTGDARRKPVDKKRLEKGPAFKDGGSDAAGETASGPRTRTGWPLYRHNPLRSGVAATVVPAELKTSWKTGISGTLTQPVVSGGKVLVASVDENTVYALDEKTGSIIWKYTAGGRIDSPPSIYRNRVFFGSASGHVYALRLSDGKMIWRFFAAPSDIRAVSYNQVESLWPVHGSVLVLDGVLYFTAGRSSWLDGGIFLYALDPGSGRIIAKGRCKSRHPTIGEGKEYADKVPTKRFSQNITDYKTFHEPDESDAFSMRGGVVSDVLVSDGFRIFLHHAAFSTGLKQRDSFSRHLFSTSSLLDDKENHRSHWVLGTGDFTGLPVAYSWVVNRPKRRRPTIAVPTGVMMVFDDTSVWGVRRKGDANGRYYLFKRSNKPFSRDEKALPDFRRIPKKQVEPYVWRQDLPVRPHAMVKAGAHLFLGVMPVDIPENDPHAAYEGRRGGAVWVINAADGMKAAELPLESPVKWDGMAAANGRLYISTYAGEILCLAEK